MGEQIYYTLGRSSLTVSRLAFGVMTFGSYAGVGTDDWGAEEAEARRMFDFYRDWGGNFFDTAPSYTFGESEKMLGRFIKEAGCRDEVVISTKFTHPHSAEGPNGGGACRNNVIRSVEHSLQRLDTDYIDLLFVHVWDRRTPPEELAVTLNDLVRQGKVRYIGMSNVPAWYIARFQSVAEFRGLEKACAVQLEYSLIERDIENEYTDMCLDLDMSYTAFGAVAAGFLTGKYKDVRRGGELSGSQGRLGSMKDVPAPQVQKFSERNWAVHDALEEVANELGKPMAQVAINWAANRPAVGSIICGASKLAQLEGNLNALDFEMPGVLMDKLTAASEVPLLERPIPYGIIDRESLKGSINAGLEVHEKRPGYYDAL